MTDCITSDYSDIVVKGKVYKAFPAGVGCSGCDLNPNTQDDKSLCATAMTFSNYCVDNNKIWKEVNVTNIYKSITQEIQDFNYHLVKDEFETQLPGTKYDQDKLQYTLIPPHALAEVARNLTIGLKKYKERDNWKKVPNAEQRYLDALYRHLEAHRRGEIYDPDSSVPDMPHLAAVAVNAMFLLEFMLNPDLKEK